MKVEKITFLINYFVCIKEFKYSDKYYLILFLKIIFRLRLIFQKLSFICI